MQAVQLSIPLDAKPVANVDAAKKQTQGASNSNSRLGSKVKVVNAKCARQKRSNNFDFVGVAG